MTEFVSIKAISDAPKGLQRTHKIFIMGRKKIVSQILLPAAVTAASFWPEAKVDDVTVVCRADLAAAAAWAATVIAVDVPPTVTSRSCIVMVGVPVAAGRWPWIAGVKLADTAW